MNYINILKELNYTEYIVNFLKRGMYSDGEIKKKCGGL